MSPAKTMPKALVWLQALRAYSFPATIIPVLLALATAIQNHQAFTLGQVSLIILGVVSLHAGTNLVNDYYDFQKGQDTKKTLGSSRVLVDGLLTPQELRLGILVCYALAIACGLFFFSHQGIVIALLLLSGLIGSYMYTGGSFAFKYRALGELAVFVLLGPLLFIGSYVALTGGYSTQNLGASVVLGLLSTAILTANNIRDIEDDRRGKIQTLGTLLGQANAAHVYTIEIILPYILVCLFILCKIFPLPSVLVVITLPLAIQLIRTVQYSKRLPAAIVENTAKFQVPFGLLLALSFIISMHH